MSQHLEYIAQIFVPTSGERGNIGTAYPVAPNRLITAAHVFKEERNGIVVWHEDAEVNWNQHRATAKLGWQPGAKVIWNGNKEGFDVAVLEVEFPPEIHRYATASWNFPTSGSEFGFRGFAAIGKDDVGRVAVSFSGKILPIVPIDDEIQIEVSSGPKDDNGWRGLSGAPVIIDNRLCAVLVNFRLGFSMGRVGAIAIQKMIGNLHFLKAAMLSLQKIAEEQQLHAQTEIATILKDQKEFTPYLIQQMKGQGYANADIDKKDKKHQAEAIATIFLAIDPRTKVILEMLLKAFRSARRSLPVSAAPAILRIVQLFLPIKPIGNGSLDFQIEDGNTLSLDAFSRIMAELALARLERRAANFDRREKSGALPKGSRAFTKKQLLSPEFGAQTSPDSMGNAVIEHLFSSVAITHSETGDTVPLVDEEGRNLTKWEAKLKYLRRRLNYFRQNGGSPYFPYTAKENDDEDGKLDVTAKDLRQKLPELVVIKLTGDDDRFDAECDEFETLSKLIDELTNFGSQLKTGS